MSAERAGRTAAPIRSVLSRAGAPGRRAARAVDATLLFGPGPVWRQARQRRAGGGLGPEARKEVYARIWSDAARAVGADLEDLGHGFLRLGRGGAAVLVRQQLTPLDDPVTLALALDKPLSQGALAAAQVPVPEQVAFHPDDAQAALDLLARVGTCVVKPAAGTAGGEGVTVGIRSREDLRRACALARHWSQELVAERHVPGLLHRVLLLDGEVLDVVVDHPPHVTGDGRSTVEQLIAGENDRRRQARGAAGLEPLDLDLDLALALRDAGLTLASVLPAGTRVAVKSATNDRGPEDSQTSADRLHPEVVDVLRRAVAASGLRLVGVDVLAFHLRLPLAETGGVVLELNGAPGLHRHYQVRDAGRATRVAEPVLELMLREARSARRGAAAAPLPR